MGLMDKSTVFPDYQKSQNGMKASALEVKVGGVKLVESSKLNITNMEVEITCGNEASGASFEILGEYKPALTDFSTDIKKIEIGERIEIELGYIERELVFVGYICQVEYLFGLEDDNGKIRVECMDAKGLLMKKRRLEVFKDMKASDLINQILSEHGNLFLKSTKVDDLAYKRDYRLNMRSDYEVLVEIANKYGYEFFIVAGDLFFRKKEAVNSNMITLSPENGIITAKLALTSQQLVNKIEVRSISEKDGTGLVGSKTISGKFSETGAASSLLSHGEQIYYEAGAMSQADVQDRANARMKAVEESFGVLEVETVGNPKIIPGRFLKVEKLAKVANHSYYVTYVRHMLNEEGFTTFIKARLKSL